MPEAWLLSVAHSTPSICCYSHIFFCFKSKILSYSSSCQ